MNVQVFPCSKSGKILKGFCPTICESPSAFMQTLSGWLRFANKFNIKYYSYDGQVRHLLTSIPVKS